MAGGPSQLELFDPKPKLNKLNGQTVPESFTQGKRFAFIKGDAKLLGSTRKFAKAGQCGMDLSELLPHHREIVDDLCWLRGMKTDVFNHGPAKCFVNTGSPQFGRPSMGAWVTYGLGSESTACRGSSCCSPARAARAAARPSGPAASCRPSIRACRSSTGPNPILDLAPPPGVDAKQQGEFVDAVSDLNKLRLDATGDPEIETRIAAYEMAYRMQTAAPELMDLSKETAGDARPVRRRAGQAVASRANCLLARRLVERGVRFVQLYHTDWDHHGGAVREPRQAPADRSARRSTSRAPRWSRT